MRTVTYDETKYRMVPLAPTREMLAAAQRAWINDPARKTSTLWRAMLAAATDHPATAGDAEDAARLEWVLRHTPGDALRYSVGVLADTADLSEFRAAIDAKRASKGGE